ncbi:MAG: DUF86 domain-containing protein [Nitrospirae bacterium]|jgi:uncharacterized protein with HEPN domain|nr:DUF86 domain-containing protein [Nitrospirota bacterium]
MSKKRRDTDFLTDVIEAAERSLQYTKGLTRKKFMSDKKSQDAVVRNLEIIGEATKNLSNSLKTKYPAIPWKNIAGLRDKLIHFYFGIDYNIVWNIVRKELPKIGKQLREILVKETE